MPCRAMPAAERPVRGRADRSRAGSLHEVGKRHSKNARDEEESVEGGRGLTLLDANVGGAVHGNGERHRFLGQVRVQPRRPDPVADLASSGENPVGWRSGAWHVLHAHGTKIEKL